MSSKRQLIDELRVKTKENEAKLKDEYNAKVKLRERWMVLTQNAARNLIGQQSVAVRLGRVGAVCVYHCSDVHHSFLSTISTHLRTI